MYEKGFSGETLAFACEFDSLWPHDEHAVMSETNRTNMTTRFIDLPRRKHERPAREQMHVKMKHSLPAVGVSVYHNAITIVRKMLLTCDLGGGMKQMPKHFFMVPINVIERVNMIARNDQNMRRRLRTQIIERDAHLIVINPRRRYLTRHYLAKNTIPGNHTKLTWPFLPRQLQCRR